MVRQIGNKVNGTFLFSVSVERVGKGKCQPFIVFITYKILFVLGCISLFCYWWDCIVFILGWMEDWG